MSHRFEHKFERTLESQSADSDVTTVRRLELITGTGRRRQWSADDKARIVIESLKPGANVSEVARRHGLSPQQLFGWRRQAREAVGNAQPAFAPVVIASATSSPAPTTPPSPPADTAMRGVIEVAIGDAIVRVRGQVETGLLVAVLRAVRRAS